MADAELITKALEYRDQCKQHTKKVFGGFTPGGAFQACSYTEGGWGASNCYAGFSQSANGVLSLIFSAWHCGVRKEGVGKYNTPETQAFLKWLFTESPWGKLINAAPWYEYISPKGFILGDLETVPGTLTYGFLIASRTPFEYPMACRGWYWLVSAGVNPALAYQAVCMGYKLTGTSIDSSHGPNYDCNSIGEEYLRNFVNAKPNPGNVGAAGRISRGVNQLWSAHGDQRGNGIPLTSLWSELYQGIVGKPVAARDAWGGALPKQSQNLISIETMLKEQERLGLV